MAQELRTFADGVESHNRSMGMWATLHKEDLARMDATTYGAPFCQMMINNLEGADGARGGCEGDECG